MTQKHHRGALTGLSAHSANIEKKQRSSAVWKLSVNRSGLKWVRYFLDFEAKYGATGAKGDRVDPFIAKLASKGQSQSLCRQARKAVRIYLG